MQKASRLKKYVELFKKNISRYLADGIEIRSTIYPVESEGAVFEFLLNNTNDNNEVIEKARPTVGSVLSEIPQRLIVGNIDSVRFSGTNLYLEGNRILIIKGEDDSSSWSGNAVLEDVQRVVSTSQGGKTA
ncbi:hypothetical protein SAMN02745127_02782 [Oceanospirillum multiglobuliferum]|uniref:Uncharacterized protein n=1 Tax=Oceanospirillum multiglobuliferum TaxID=64969 RepID=A0A1T4S5M8_9GAMM|nr:hypothetical protein [Oceanospirillum multiglobuliferum]OPX54468.1 hypothetical protein BTE48_14225 [Oceanospirillum multiglobuliferum]SKA23554.1 hypothetical protein SAMN02745127_02782 [Oceanospirillum multiglobuliferum]